MSLETYKWITATGTLVLLFLIVALIIFRIVAGKNSTIMQFLRRHALPFGFFLALAAMVGSLVYSNIFSFTPCVLCWWQRILIYPQVLLLGIAWYREKKGYGNGKSIFVYSLSFAVIGSTISLYHTLLQRGIITKIGDCIQGGVSCSKIDLQVFGSITIPVMALAIGIALVCLGVLSINKKTTD